MKNIVNNICIILTIIIITSCYSYKPFNITKKIFFEDKTENNGLLINYKRNNPKFKKIYREKYLTVICDFSTVSKINNKGVSLALKGKFIQAEILFKDVIKELTGKDNIDMNDKLPEVNDGAVFSNLGVVYELFGKKDLAFQMYSIACSIEPGNQYFRRNFLTFIDSGKRKQYKGR